MHFELFARITPIRGLLLSQVQTTIDCPTAGPLRFPTYLLYADSSSLSESVESSDCELRGATRSISSGL